MYPENFKKIIKSTRDNTRIVSAHIPTDLKREFDQKLLDTDRTMQDVLTELVKAWVKPKK
jgi:hypothetical protein